MLMHDERTTVTVDDHIVRAARQLAAERGITLGAARSELACRGSRSPQNPAQNGVIRTVSHPRYSNAQPTPETAVTSLRSLITVGRHRFVADDVSLLDDAVIGAPESLTSSAVTDVYLIALARHHDVLLATFDRRIPVAPIRGGHVRVAQIP